jgi:ADP-ribosylglycohydrolase
MFGLAYGDALGRPTEFLSSAKLAKLGDPFHKRIGINSRKQGIVTDDTQMAIAVARAALTKGRPGNTHITARLIHEFIRWGRDPKSHDGLRAPGVTCTGAVSALAAGQPWTLATRTGSKGNGANMRVAPLALRTDWTYPELGAVAQVQAAITHGHPAALAAAEMTAVAVRMLLEGVAEPRETLIDSLLSYAHNQRRRYRADWLGYLWTARAYERQPVVAPQLLPTGPQAKSWWNDAAPSKKPRWTVSQSGEDFIERGWETVIDVLVRVGGAVRKPDQDPCQVGGEGWVAEEALGCALVCLLTFPGDPANALRRAAFTNGDSDSIGAITGALAGAAYGLKAFPSHWYANIEYRGELDGLAAALTDVARP